MNRSMCLSAFLSDLIEDKGFHPEQIKLVVDNTGWNSVPSPRSPTTLKKTHRCSGQSDRKHDMVPSDRTAREMRHCASDSSLFVSKGRGFRSFSHRSFQSHKFISPRKLPEALRQRQRSREDNLTNRNSEWPISRLQEKTHNLKEQQVSKQGSRDRLNNATLPILQQPLFSSASL